MKLAAIQPGYFPWLGHFEQVQNADIFIILEDLYFSKNSWVNRNRIINNKKIQWLTVPILHQQNQLISEVIIDNTTDWKKKHINAIKYSYPKSQCNDDLTCLIKESQTCDLLSYLRSVNTYLYQLFDFNDKVKYEKTMKMNPDKNLRLIELCNKYHANEYISGMAGKDYLDIELFLKHGIKIRFQDYKPVMYTQNSKVFISHLSILDPLLSGITPEVIVRNGFYNESNSLRD
jgi:hypothetical protein